MFSVGDRVAPADGMVYVNGAQRHQGTVILVVPRRSTLGGVTYRVNWDGEIGVMVMAEHQLRYLELPPADRSPATVERWLVS